MPPEPSGRAASATGPPSVSVILTVLKDPRVERTLESLLAQSRPPEEILVDDGGGDDRVARIAERFAERDARVVHLDAPGTIAESRNRALEVAKGEIVAFLDADEVAPAQWLAELIAPFADPSVGFTGGPTPALPETLASVGARYYDGYLRRFYDEVASRHPEALPMGNSAWRRRLFRELGPLDTSLDPRASSEDQEFGVRARAAGWQGRYVPSAWVHHDFAGLDLPALLRKQRRYAKGGFVVWRRSGSTYEASGGRVAPYVLLPLFAVAGALLLVPAPTRLVGAILALAGLGGLGLLAVLLTIVGLGRDERYPGLRYSALEIPRRWATLLGALDGLRDYGWSGRRGLPSPVPRRGTTGPGDAAPPPESSSGKL